jgi:hypothetical protein
MIRGELGQICTPLEGRSPLPGVTWCADNNCFTRYPGDHKLLEWLTRLAPHAGRCLFATAPDVVGDAEATRQRSAPWLPIIRDLGYPVAWVGQDGAEHIDVPFDSFDVLFLGGSTEWKLGPHAARLAATARGLGKSVHLGRCNSAKRWAIAEMLGCGTVDGTFLAFGPDRNLPRLRRWITPDQLSLFQNATD